MDNVRQNVKKMPKWTYGQGPLSAVRVSCGGAGSGASIHMGLGRVGSL